MNLPVGLSSCPKTKTTQEWLRKNVPAFIRAEVWPSGSPDLTPWTINCGLFWKTWLAETSRQLGQPEEIPRESSGRDHPEDGACRDSGLAGASQGLRSGRGRPF